ncbi:MAG: 3-oxoacyl-[acyl-carrier-protein] reductase [Culicoidibacterales bacterium]
MLTNQVAVVTGASRGIGYGIALELASLGANLVVNYNSSVASMEQLVETIKTQYPNVKVVAVQANIAEFEQAKRLVDTAIEEFGRIDILVNNAGITKDGLLMRMSEADFDNVVDVNLKGSFNCMRHAIKPMMKQRSGRIINLSSVSGVSGNAGQVNYAASKAGVIGMTKSLAREVATRNITVNAIAPGFIETEMTAKLNEGVQTAIKGQIPMQRFGQVSDIAKTVAFLSSQAANYITGQVITVDGGMTM